MKAFKKMVLPKEKTYRDTMANREKKVPYKIFEEVIYIYYYPIGHIRRV